MPRYSTSPREVTTSQKESGREVVCSHRIHRPILQSRHVGTNDRGCKQRQILQRISMSGFGSLVTTQGSFVEAFLACFREGSAARVGVVETAVCGAVD